MLQFKNVLIGFAAIVCSTLAYADDPAQKDYDGLFGELKVLSATYQKKIINEKNKKEALGNYISALLALAENKEKEGLYDLYSIPYSIATKLGMLGNATFPQDCREIDEDLRKSPSGAGAGQTIEVVETREVLRLFCPQFLNVPGVKSK